MQPAHQDAAALRRILTAYFGVVVESLAGAVPKTVVLHLRAFVQRFQTHLVRALQDAGPASLLVEDETTAAGRDDGRGKGSWPSQCPLCRTPATQLLRIY